MTRIANVLSIAGSDPSGGAGIQADLKAFSAMGTYGMAVITALTAQNTVGVSAVHMVPPEMVRAQIRDIFADIRVDAVKIGMIGTAEVAEAVADALGPHVGVPVALDPVMVAKGGDRLLRADAVATLKARLVPIATVVTPNLGEAADLLDDPPIEDRAGMEPAARAILALGPANILLKGGHLGGGESPDLLLSRDSATWFEGPRFASRNTHGTGCTLSSALAALLATGLPLGAAVARAKSYVAGAIQHADQLDVGHGHGPTHHFHALWRA